MPQPLAVVIPVHKENPDVFERISLLQCVNVLSNWPIYLILPKSVNPRQYLSLSKNLRLFRVPDKWLESLDMYNKFKLSHYFYQNFSNYSFILTYELDAFVFKDDLLNWINKGFDYVGAPWFKDYNNQTENELIGVGNSGFSLRKTKNVHQAIAKYFLSRSGKNRIERRLFPNYDSQLLKNQPVFEDWFISNRLGVSLDIASIEQAIPFSFEYNPSKLFELNDFQLPTGCHAWYKYDLDFWKPHIEKFGHQIP